MHYTTGVAASFIASVLVALSSQAQDGFDAASVRSFLDKRMVHVPKSEPPSVEDDYRMLSLGQAIENFRTTAVLASKIDLVAQLTDSSPGALGALEKGELSSKFPYIWPYVIAGSFFVVGNSLSDEPVAALYNPYFDVAILTRWSAVKAADQEDSLDFQLTEAVPITGRAFMEDRSSQINDSPIWAESKAGFEVKFVEASQNFVREFESRYPPFGRKATRNFEDSNGTQRAVAGVEHLVMNALRWVRDAKDPNAQVNYSTEIQKVQGALSSPFSSELERMLPDINPQKAGIFFRLGADIRKGMKPYLVVDQTVIMINPVNLPLGFISLHVEQHHKEGPIGLLALFNLEAQYPTN